MRKRDIKKNFWLSEAEDIKFKNKAKKLGLTEAQMFRCLINDYEPREKPDDRFYEVMKPVRAMSISLNQIAKKTNALGFVDFPYYKKEAEKWNKFMVDIKNEFLSTKEIK